MDDKAASAADQALIAAWLRGDFDDEIRYLPSPVSSHQGKKEYPKGLSAGFPIPETQLTLTQFREDIWRIRLRLCFQVVLFVSHRIRGEI